MKQCIACGEPAIVDVDESCLHPDFRGKDSGLACLGCVAAVASEDYAHGVRDALEWDGLEDGE